MVGAGERPLGGGPSPKPKLCGCFACSHWRAVNDLNMLFFFLLLSVFLIVSFPFHPAPILSRNKNLTLMRERGFDFHFPLRVWHIFFIFLLVQLIVSVRRVCDTIPCTARRARGERGELCLYNFCVYTTFKVSISSRAKT